MGVHTRIYPQSGKALAFTAGTDQYGQDIDGFWKIWHSTHGLIVPDQQAVEIRSNGATIKVNGQIFFQGAKKASFVDGTWTDQ